MKRLALVGASLVLVGGMTAACGGAPEDASKGDFCKAMLSLADADDKDKFEDAVDEIKDTGTPEEIDGDAREGFELYLDALEDVDADDLENAEEPDFSDDDEKKFVAFQEKFTEVCADEMQKQMEDQMGDLDPEATPSE